MSTKSPNDLIGNRTRELPACRPTAPPEGNSSISNTVVFCIQQLCCDVMLVRLEVLLTCGNKMPTRCNRGFYCRSYCLLNMFRASLCPSSGAQEYYTVVAACGILCCGISSCWSGVELRVMRPVCRMLVYCLCFVACITV